MRKPLAVGLTVLGMLAVAALWVGAQPRPSQDDSAATVRASQADALRPLDTRAAHVRLLLGVEDRQPQPWDGRLTLDRGTVAGVEGWRFRAGDAVNGPDAWQARSHLVRKVAAKKAMPRKTVQRGMEKGGPGNIGPAVTPNGVVTRLDAPRDSTLILASSRGEARIPLADLASGAPRTYLDGQVEARLVPAYAPITNSAFQEDFPAAAPDGKGGAWVAYVEHQPRGSEVSEALTEPPASFKSFLPSGGGDQIKLIHFVMENGRGSVARILDVTDSGLDVWRPAVAVARDGQVVLAWSEQQDGNWDLFTRTYEPSKNSWTSTRRLTSDPAADTDVVLACDPARSPDVWMAWQSWKGGQAQILLTRIEGTEPPIRVTSHLGNDWSPALVYRDGTLHVAFDTYEAGNYDVMLWSRADSDEGPGRTVAVADSSLFEARPSLAVDARGRAWVAYEERPANWGKDFGNIPDDSGTGLYQASAVRVRCVEGDKVLDAGNPVAAAPAAERSMNAFARLTLDRNGRPRLLFRHRQEAIWGGNAVMVVGAVWVEHVTALVGQSWTPPQPLPRSDGLLDNRPALVVHPEGPLLVFYNGDGRLHRELEFTDDLRRRFYTHSGTPAGVVNNDLFVAALPDPSAYAGQPEAEPGGPVAREKEPVPPVHPDEAEDVARMRRHRIQAGGKTYQLLRGEFHRHTELSQDGGNDGALEDMWRYALDVADLDWIGNGDHDNGGGKEYTWWLVQKTTDLYHNPSAFVPMHTYERSVGYPGGHRNVMFPFRGVRTLPRLIDDRGVQTDVGGRDLDAAMLHRYLNELGGICASHTSATGMGTDWRANDPKAEPFVEIYQGVRNSYEYFGGPRVAHSPRDAVGGWRPLGMVWNALAMQYRLAFQASSDHVSTHISFGIAIAEAPTRQAIFDAFRKRHCYAATDNILLDVRCGEHLMGDEFTAEGPVTLKILAHGTAPIARVDIIKDFHHVYTAEPGEPRVEFAWTDEEEINRGPSWYYVRLVQQDGEVAWGTPFWIHARADQPADGR